MSEAPVIEIVSPLVIRAKHLVVLLKGMVHREVTVMNVMLVLRELRQVMVLILCVVIHAVHLLLVILAVPVFSLGLSVAAFLFDGMLALFFAMLALFFTVLTLLLLLDSFLLLLAGFLTLALDQLLGLFLLRGQLVLLVVTVRGGQLVLVGVVMVRRVRCVVMHSRILVRHSILGLMTVRIVLLVMRLCIVVAIMMVALVLVWTVRVRQVVVRWVNCPGMLQIVMHVLLIVLESVMVPSDRMVHGRVMHWPAVVGSSIPVVMQIVVPCRVVVIRTEVVISRVVLNWGATMVHGVVRDGRVREELRHTDVVVLLQELGDRDVVSAEELTD